MVPHLPGHLIFVVKIILYIPTILGASYACVPVGKRERRKIITGSIESDLFRVAGIFGQGKIAVGKPVEAERCSIQQRGKIVQMWSRRPVCEATTW